MRAERRASQIMLKAKAREAGCRITVGAVPLASVTMPATATDTPRGTKAMACRNRVGR